MFNLKPTERERYWQNMFAFLLEMCMCVCLPSIHPYACILIVTAWIVKFSEIAIRFKYTFSESKQQKAIFYKGKNVEERKWNKSFLLSTLILVLFFPPSDVMLDLQSFCKWALALCNGFLLLMGSASRTFDPKAADWRGKCNTGVKQTWWGSYARVMNFNHFHLHTCMYIHIQLIWMCWLDCLLLRRDRRVSAGLSLIPDERIAIMLN